MIAIEICIASGWIWRPLNSMIPHVVKEIDAQIKEKAKSMRIVI
jgi:hypothetical protein